MKLKTQTIKDFKNIMERDYGILLSDSKAEEFGSSLLRLTRLAITAIAKAEENKIKNENTLTS